MDLLNCSVPWQLEGGNYMTNSKSHDKTESQYTHLRSACHSPTHTHTHSLSHTLSHTHSHTHSCRPHTLSYLNLSILYDSRLTKWGALQVNLLQQNWEGRFRTGQSLITQNSRYTVTVDVGLLTLVQFHDTILNFFWGGGGEEGHHSKANNITSHRKCPLSRSLAPRHPQGSLSWTRHISCCRVCGSVMSSLGVEAEFTCDFKNLKTHELLRFLSTCCCVL